MDFDDKDTEKRKKRIQRHSKIGFFLTTSIILLMFVLSNMRDGENMEQIEGITHIRLETNGTGMEIKDFWVSFTEYNDNMFFDEYIQKEFSDCYYSGGTFNFHSKLGSYQCTYPEKSIIIN